MKSNIHSGSHVRAGQGRYALALLVAGILGLGGLLAGAPAIYAQPGERGAAIAPAISAQQGERRVAELPTIVLVHGAFADATGWTREVTLLQRAGFPVLAPADPLRGLTTDADYIRSILSTIEGPVVLVGHSYGGAVITNAARGADNVIALVYVAAFIPDEGSSVASSYDPAAHPGSLLTPDALTVRPVANPAAPGGEDADLYIQSQKFRRIFASDQTSATAAAMAATQRPLSYFAFTEPSGEPAWKTIPSWALITREDRAISPGGQRYMAVRAGAETRSVNSAHDVMISHPRAVVSIILEAAGMSG